MSQAKPPNDSDTPAEWRVGDTVPWSVAWTAEQAFRLQPSRLFPGKLEVGQIDKAGQGEPLFASIHVERHRRAMAEHLCHVCGKPMQDGDRWVFLHASGGAVTLHDGSEQFGAHVPALHRACAERAREQCPHHGRLNDEPINTGDDAGRLIPRTDVVPGMEALARTVPPGAEVVFSCYRLYGTEFTRRMEQARADWEARAKATRRTLKETGR